MRRPLIAGVLLASTVGCMAHMNPMQVALDATTQRVEKNRGYLAVVSAISADPRRMTRSDGYTYLADVAPQLRYMAITGDAAGYGRLLAWSQGRLVVSGPQGVALRRRYRDGGTTEPAQAYGALRMAEALALGWSALKDTTAATLAARLTPLAPEVLGSDVARRIDRCATAEQSAATDRAGAAAVLKAEKKFVGGISDAEADPFGLRGDEADLVLFSCLTRVAVSAKDPDATVRYLEQILDRTDKMRRDSGRPSSGTSSEMLLTFRMVQAAEPKY